MDAESGVGRREEAESPSVGDIVDDRAMRSPEEQEPEPAGAETQESDLVQEAQGIPAMGDVLHALSPGLASAWRRVGVGDACSRGWRACSLSRAK